MPGSTSVGVKGLIENPENSGSISLSAVQDPNEGNSQESSRKSGPTCSTPSSNGSCIAKTDPFDIFESVSQLSDAHTPPRAIQNIFQVFPSVAATFPEWPFHPPESSKNPRIEKNKRTVREIEIRQHYGQELYMTRLFTPGTAAHRLFGNFNRDVKKFCTEYEDLQKNGFQPSEGQAAYVPGMDANVHNIEFKCSICEYSPGPKEWPNWLFYTKENSYEPRYLYCLKCKQSDRWVGLKSMTSLNKVVKDIVSVCQAEKQARQRGLDRAIASVAMAKMKRYCIMFDIEVQAAMVRRLLNIYQRAEAAKRREEAESESKTRTSQAMTDLNLSYFGTTAAQAIMDRFFNPEVPKLLNMPGLLGHPDRIRSTTPPGVPSSSCPILKALNISIKPNEAEEGHVDVCGRSITPKGWPMGYFPTPNEETKVFEVLDQPQGAGSSTFPERPTTPVWFAARPRNPSPGSDHSTSTISDVIGLYDTSEDDDFQFPSSAGSSSGSLGELSNSAPNDSFLSLPAVSSESLPGVTNNENSRPSSSYSPNGESSNPATHPLSLQNSTLRRTPSYANNLHSLGKPNIRPDRSQFYQCKTTTSDGEALATTHGAESDPEVNSSLDDISVDWDSDGSFDDPPRKLKCLDKLDEMFPPVSPLRREIEEAIAKYDNLPQQRKQGSWRLSKWRNPRSRPVDKSLLVIGEEEDEEDDKKQGEKEKEKGKGKQRGGG